MASLLFYKNPTALEKNKHKALKLRTDIGLDFAKQANSVPLAAVEFFKAGRNFPIFFIKKADESYIPVALLSLRKDEHDLDDRFNGYYVPIFIRRYPFALTDEGLVIVDESSQHLTYDESPQAQDLFDQTDSTDKADEGHTKTLSEVIKFLRTADAAYKSTEAFTKALADKNVLKPFATTVSYKSVKVKLDGLYTIDEESLRGLDDQTALEWFKSNYLAWSYAQMNSVDSLATLAELQAEAQEAKAVQANATQYKQD